MRRIVRELWWWPLAGVEAFLDLVGRHNASDDLRLWMERRLPDEAEPVHVGSIDAEAYEAALADARVRERLDRITGSTRQSTMEDLLRYIESLPIPPPTHFPWLRRILWWAADECGDRKWSRFSCLFHDIGWWLP